MEEEKDGKLFWINKEMNKIKDPLKKDYLKEEVRDIHRAEE